MRKSDKTAVVIGDIYSGGGAGIVLSPADLFFFPRYNKCRGTAVLFVPGRNK